MNLYTPSIDMHAHFLPESYKELLARYNITRPDDYPLPEWTVDLQLAAMEAFNIRYALLSVSSPHINRGDHAEAARYARRINIESAGYARLYPEKFGVAASLPLPDPQASIREVEYCVNELGVKGFAWPSHALGVYLGNPELDPVLERIDRHGLCVVMHPTTPAAVPDNVNRRLPIPVFEFFVDSGRVMMNMFLNGTLRKFPHIRFVIPHGGAFMPLITERVQGVVDLPMTPYPEVDVLGDMRRLYFDTTGVGEDKRLRALLEVADEDHVFFGSDFPHAPVHVRHRGRLYIQESAVLGDAQREKLLMGNAARVLGL